jgi:hypothetical protein
MLLLKENMRMRDNCIILFWEQTSSRATRETGTELRSKKDCASSKADMMSAFPIGFKVLGSCDFTASTFVEVGMVTEDEGLLLREGFDNTFWGDDESKSMTVSCCELFVVFVFNSFGILFCLFTGGREERRGSPLLFLVLIIKKNSSN